MVDSCLRARRTDIPRDTDGINVFNIISPIENNITTKSNVLKYDRKYAAGPSANNLSRISAENRA